MNFAACRWCTPLMLALGLLFLAQTAFAQPPTPTDGPIPPEPLATRP